MIKVVKNLLGAGYYGFIWSFYSLTPAYWEKYWTYVFASFVIYGILGSCLYLVLKYKYGPKTTTKQIAHLLATVASLLTSILSTPIAIGALGLYAKTNEEAADYMLRNTCYTEFVMILYAVYLGLDLLGAYFIYPKQMDLLAGWVHHVVYLLQINAALKGEFSTALCAFFVEELPTFILDCGTLFPKLRSDWGFGLTFILLRIVYHGFITVVFIYKTHDYCTWMCILTWCLHAWWMNKWILRMIRISHSGGISPKMQQQTTKEDNNNGSKSGLKVQSKVDESISSRIK